MVLKIDSGLYERFLMGFALSWLRACAIMKVESAFVR